MNIHNINKYIETFGEFIDRQVKPVAKFLIYLRVPLTVALASYFVLTQVDQTIEVYRSIALDKNYLEGILATASVTILTFFVFYAVRLLELYKYNRKKEKSTK
jgi:hypothetical protein